jgi:hypothetical protein
MQTRWNKNLDDQGKKDLNSSLLASNFAFSQLAVLISDDIDSSVKANETKGGYESPNWAYAQADHIGELRAYRKILRLIDLKEA